MASRSPGSIRTAFHDMPDSLPALATAVRRIAGRGQDAARSRSRAVTALPSAWPLVAFMTWPTKNPVSLPRALSSPSTKRAHSSGWPAMTSSTAAGRGRRRPWPRSPWPWRWRRGRRPWRPSRPARPWPGWRSARRRSPCFTSAASRPGARSAGAVDGQVVLDVGEHPAGLGRPRRWRRAPGRRGPARPRWPPRRRPSTPRPRRGQAARRRSAGSAGSAASTRATHSAPGSSGHEVGLGEVAVVLRLLLDAQRVGAAVVLVPVAGLLAHRLARLDQVDLPAGLVVDGPARASAAS